MPLLIATNTMPNGDTVHTVAKQFMRSGVSQDVEENTQGSFISTKALQREEEGLKALFDDDKELCKFAPQPLPKGSHQKRPEEMEALKKKVKGENIDQKSKERLLGLLEKDKPPTHHGQYDVLYHVSEELKHLLERTKDRVRKIDRRLKRPRGDTDDEGEAGDKTAAPKPKRMRSQSVVFMPKIQPLRRTVSVPTPSMLDVPEPAKLEKVLETSA